MRNFFKAIALSAVVLAICLILADISLPLFITVPKATLESDPLLGLHGRPEASMMWNREVDHPVPLRLNRYGFHDVERSMQKRPGTFRIVSLGDSFVESYQVPLDENFSRLLEKTLNGEVSGASMGKGPEKVEVCNQGVHGYGLGVYYLYVEHRIDAWSPDMVLLCIFMGNDLMDNYDLFATHIVPRFRLINGQLQYFPPEQTTITWLRDHVIAHSSLAMELSENVIKRNAGLIAVARNNGFISWASTKALTEEQRSELLGIARLQLHAIKKHLAARHANLFVLVIPDPFRVQDLAAGHTINGSMTTFPSDRAYLEHGLLETLQMENIPYAYPVDIFTENVRNGHGMYLQGVGHLTARAHRIVADCLNSRLLKVICPGANQANARWVGSQADAGAQ